MEEEWKEDVAMGGEGKKQKKWEALKARKKEKIGK